MTALARTATAIPLAVCALALILATPTKAMAEDQEDSGPRPMTIVDLLEVPQISQVALGPTGKWAVFVRSEADWDANRRMRHIWRTNRETGESRQITSSSGEQAGESNPTFSPDGQRIVFLAQRGDDEHNQVYVLPLDGGEARRLFAHPSAPSSLEFSSDGRYLYFTAPEPLSKEEKAKKEAKDDVIAYDEDYKQRHLWRLDLRQEGDDTKAERLTEGDFSIGSYSLPRKATDPNATERVRLLVHRAPTPRFDDSDESELWRLDIEPGEEEPELRWRQLTSNQVPEFGAELSPDGRTVLFLAGANEEFEFYHGNNIFLLPIDGGAARLLMADSTHHVDAARWTEGGEIVFLANTGVRSQLFRLDPRSEEFSALTEGDHSTRNWHYQPQRDEHLVAFSSAHSPGDLSVLEGSGERRQISSLFDHYAEDFSLPRLEAVRWAGDDGQEVEGLLWYPLDYQEGQRYPLVVQTHGGPSASDKFAFGRWINYPQVLAARGWMVFQPNYRGSTGYGDAFQRDMVGHYFNQSHLDVMTGVDALIERGLVDGERMVKMGWSAGGHMTNKIITHTDRFKAASSGAGAINWISMYGQSDVRIYRTPWFGGTPWEQDAPITNYWESSPLKDIWRVKTPTLVLVGQNDLRVPAAQSIELFRALQSHDVPSHLYMAPRAGHGWRELRHELFKVNVELEWFEKWALGREYEWEKAPVDDEEEDDEASAKTTAVEEEEEEG